MRHRRVILVRRVTWVAYRGWIWLVVDLVITGFFVFRCLRWVQVRPLLNN